MRLRQILSAKIHRATITEADVNYVGSITIDQDLLDRTGMAAGEYVHVWNATNGERLETYIIAGERGSGVICMNGPAAMRCRVGDRVIVATFALTDEPENVVTRAILVDEQNRFAGYIEDPLTQKTGAAAITGVTTPTPAAV
ncbi:MAG TPA: aspartate 1-decarboxylase [Armatimonadaceae bacterium]|nr:aspartate 1-decarboxylase [Armatimonadaceae bacterium]